jgi:hypothetical protein
VIRETDRRIEADFADTFEATARNFEELAEHLFPGGRGRLRLVEMPRPKPVLGGADPGTDPAEPESSDEDSAVFGLGLRANIPSIRSVTRNPPTMLIVPKAIAITPITYSSPSSANPTTISPPSITIPWIAFVCDISGVCRVVGTFEITSKPTNAASTKIVTSTIRSIQASVLRLWPRRPRGRAR